MRRPIASRQSAWAKQAARFLAERGVRPNMVSGASVACALAGHGGFLDRIDSICFAAPVFFHVTRFFWT